MNGRVSWEPAAGDGTPGHYTFCLSSAAVGFLPSCLGHWKPAWIWGAERDQLLESLWRAGQNSEAELCCFQFSGSQAPWMSKGDPSLEALLVTQRAHRSGKMNWGAPRAERCQALNTGTVSLVVVGKPENVQRVRQSKQQRCAPCPHQPGVAWEHPGLAAALVVHPSCTLLVPSESIGTSDVHGRGSLPQHGCAQLGKCFP